VSFFLSQKQSTKRGITLGISFVITLFQTNTFAQADFCTEACGYNTLQPIAWRTDGTSVVVASRAICPDGSDLRAPMVYVLEPKDFVAKHCYSLDMAHWPPSIPQNCGAWPLKSTGHSFSVEDTGLLKDHTVKATLIEPERVRVKRTVKAYLHNAHVVPPCSINGYESPVKCEHLEVSVLREGKWKTVWKGIRNAQKLCTQADGTKVDSPSDAVKVWGSPTGKHALITFRKYSVTSFRIFHDIHSEWVDLDREVGTSTTN
jgi:hypothetical protein